MILDIGIVLILIMFILIGLKNGVIKQTVSLIGLIVMFVVSYNFKGILGDFFCKICPFEVLPGEIGKITSLNIIIYEMLAFLIILFLLFLIFEIVMGITKVISKLVDATLILIIPSRILGAIVGFIEGYIVLFIILLFLMIPTSSLDGFKDSSLAPKIVYSSPILSEATKSLTKPTEEVMTLITKVNKKEISIEDANKRLLELELRYNIVSKKTVIIITITILNTEVLQNTADCSKVSFKKFQVFSFKLLIAKQLIITTNDVIKVITAVKTFDKYSSLLLTGSVCVK